MKIKDIIRLLSFAIKNRVAAMILHLLLSYWLFFDVLPVFLNDSQIGGAFIVTVILISMFTASLKFLSLSLDGALFLLNKAKLSSKYFLALIAVSLPWIVKKIRNFTPLRIPKELIKMYR